MKTLATSITLLLFTFAFCLQGTELIIVQSSKATPYQEATMVLERELISLGYKGEVQVVGLGGLVSNRAHPLKTEKKTMEGTHKLTFHSGSATKVVDFKRKLTDFHKSIL